MIDLSLTSVDNRYRLDLGKSMVGIIQLNICNIKYAAAPRPFILTKVQARELAEQLLEYAGTKE